MADTLIEKLNLILTELNSTVSGIKAIIISSSDGLKIANIINTDDIKDSDIELMHAISASIVGLSSGAANKLGMSNHLKTVMYTVDGIAIVFSIGGLMSLLCILSPDSNIGLAMIELENSIIKIKKVVRV